MVAGGNVTDAMMRFGEVLRTLYRKDDSFRKSDFSINYLGCVMYCTVMWCGVLCRAVL